MVGHLLQYHPGFIKLRQLVRDGELGRLQYLYSNRLNLGKVRREEDILWSFAPHDLSMILSLVGQEPAQVSAQGGYYLHKTIADVTTTHLTFPGGEQAHVFVSWLHPFKEQKLVVIGDRAMAVFDDGQGWSEKLLIFPHRIEWRETVPVPMRAEAVPVSLEEGEPLRLECLHFLDCAFALPCYSIRATFPDCGRRSRFQHYDDGDEPKLCFAWFIRSLYPIESSSVEADRAKVDDRLS
jgi:UDP-2-acetamido-3-amino-2,3-dideoxy-glucuronate N-acetyltransferase